MHYKLLNGQATKTAYLDERFVVAHFLTQLCNKPVDDLELSGETHIISCQNLL